MNAELKNEAIRLAEREDQRKDRSKKSTSAKRLILPGQNDTESIEEPEEMLITGEEERVGVEVSIELTDVKTATILADSRMLPADTEGLLIEHRSLPLCADLDISLVADDHEIFRERFMLPTDRRTEVAEAHAELGKVSPDFVSDSHKRDIAMGIYFPDLSEEVDVWYRVSVDENYLLSYAVHIGPSNKQEIKKKIEGQLQL
jgi:hypothetical protein